MRSSLQPERGRARIWAVQAEQAWGFQGGTVQSSLRDQIVGSVHTDSLWLLLLHNCAIHSPLMQKQ